MEALKKNFFSWFECAAWVAGLLSLALMNPAAQGHYSLCVFQLAGVSFCPGCGLGHSVSWLLHGDLQHSLNAHPLGIFALIVLLYRIFQLTKTNLTTTKTKAYANG